MSKPSFTQWLSLDTPLGPLLLGGNGAQINHAHFLDEPPPPPYTPTPKYLLHAAQFIQTYFQGNTAPHTLSLDLQGTAFQRAVWQCVLDIPFGQTSTYQSIAQKIGTPKAVRAVGAAIGKNPIAILVPCHRIIGQDGSLRGFAWGLSRKKALLHLEQPTQFAPQGSLF